MGNYKAIKTRIFSDGRYSLEPIRYEDRYKIMKWRNEQLYHLRQTKPLTKEDQDKYFDKEISDLFEKEKPEQLLFSYLENGKCIGYGGLVHLNWIDRNAEVSFIIDTALENEYFEFHWNKYLRLIEQVAFTELKLHKIYTYAFDLRPKLYKALSNSAFSLEAVLKDHCFFEGRYIDVKIHSKINRSKRFVI